MYQTNKEMIMSEVTKARQDAIKELSTDEDIIAVASDICDILIDFHSQKPINGVIVDAIMLASRHMLSDKGITQKGRQKGYSAMRWSNRETTKIDIGTVIRFNDEQMVFVGWAKGERGKDGYAFVNANNESVQKRIPQDFEIISVPQFATV
jgi:hypothetical protein